MIRVFVCNTHLYMETPKLLDINKQHQNHGLQPNLSASVHYSQNF